jgi:hypothetical protein
MHHIDLLSSLSVKIAAIATVFIGALGWVDLRYASASDLKTHMQAADRRFVDKTREEYEDIITVIEDEIAVLKAQKAVGDLTAKEALIETQLKNRKEKYLRRLKRLNPR